MKRLLGALFFFCLTTLVWGETLALTVHNDNGDPGEARSVWTQTYFTDDQGRLIRTHRVIQAEFAGDPERQEDTVYHWEAERVWWETGDAAAPVRYQVLFGEGSLDLVWENMRQKEYHGARSIRTAAGDGVRWEDGTYRYYWSREQGFEMRLMDTATNGGAAAPGYEFSTTGSRITTWRAGRLYGFALVDRTPLKLTGTFYSSFLEDNSWVATGAQTIFGAGLWNVEPRVRLIHAAILGQLFAVPFWPPFVFEEKFLK